ncbi:MAG: hypothetical protein CMO55_14430 [Verrucomicrobiales bacterium]|nr:hypothetical protein [Verrucomicrobiales bacterium]
MLLSAWFLDLVIALFGEAEPQTIDPHFVKVMAIVSIAFLILALGLQAFLFQYLLHPSRVQADSVKAIVITVIGSLAIWGLTKAAEINGLVLFFQTANLKLYLCFWTPSLFVMLIQNPYVLKPSGLRARARTSAIDKSPPLPNRSK